MSGTELVLQTVVIVTQRSLWEYFCLLASLCPQQIHLSPLNNPGLCQGYYSLHCLLLDAPIWILNIQVSPSNFQAFVNLCICAEKQDVLSVISTFPVSSLCIYIFKTVCSAELLLRAAANEMTVLCESKTLFLMVLPDLRLHKPAVAS